MRPVMLLTAIIACSLLATDGMNLRNRPSIIPHSRGYLPLQAQIKISELMGRRLPAFAARAGEVKGEYRFASLQHGVATTFDDDGMEVSSGAARWQLG